MRKWIFLVLAILLFTAGALYHAPKEVHKELQGVIYSERESFEQAAEITLIGKKYPNLLGKPIIKGIVRINDLFEYPVTLKLNGSEYSYTMTEWGEDKVLMTRGMITVSSDFSQFMIYHQDIRQYYDLNDAWVAAPPMYRGR